MPISMTINSETYYLHYDQVGTLRVVTDINHTIIKEITYDTFGNILQDTNKNFKVPFGFAGGLADRDTNLVHFGYREYDPYTGKWTAKDPIDFAGGDSNLYGYVLGDPVDLVDLNGLRSLREDWCYICDLFNHESDWCADGDADDLTESECFKRFEEEKKRCDKKVGGLSAKRCFEIAEERYLVCTRR